jgi:hypothetical protein
MSKQPACTGHHARKRVTAEKPRDMTEVGTRMRFGDESQDVRTRLRAIIREVLAAVGKDAGSQHRLPGIEPE